MKQSLWKLMERLACFLAGHDWKVCCSQTIPHAMGFSVHLSHVICRCGADELRRSEFLDVLGIFKQKAAGK